MQYEAWMTCQPLATNGTQTIGLVNDCPARWDGALGALTEEAYFEYLDDDAEFEGEALYVVREGAWEQLPAQARTLTLNGRPRVKHVAPERLEEVGRSLFVNGRDFASTLRETGRWVDPLDGKIYEWK